ncbi:unnamed protein product [Caenorhabditis brenneri]
MTTLTAEPLLKVVGDIENQSIEQLRAEFDNVKFQLHQARQVIQEKERQVKDQEEGIGKLNVKKSKIELKKLINLF